MITQSSMHEIYDRNTPCRTAAPRTAAFEPFGVYLLWPEYADIEHLPFFHPNVLGTPPAHGIARNSLGAQITAGGKCNSPPQVIDSTLL